MEVENVKGGKLESFSNVDTQEQVAVQLCGFDGLQRGNYFRGETIARAEVGHAQEWKGCRWG